MGNARLTERERKVINLLVAAKTNREVAHELGIAERTVEFHLGNVFKKLGFASRIQVAVWAVNSGWIDSQSHREESGWQDR